MPTSSSERSKAASLTHQAIRDGEFSRLVVLVTNGDLLLWEPNASGWTAVHFAVSHFLPLEWLEWILVRAFQRKDNFLKAKTALGQTVLDIFFCSYWNPLPWQSIAVKTASKRLVQACAVVRNHAVLLQAVRDAVLQQQPAMIRTGHRRQRLLTTAVHRVHRFVLRLVLLCRAACPDKETDGLEWMVAVLARNGSCPGAVVRLVLALSRLGDNESRRREENPQSTTANEKESTPLHLWAAASTHSDDDDDGLLLPLLEAYPDAPLITSSVGGLLPLQQAVAMGKSWYALQPLVRVAPVVLEWGPFLPALAALAPAPDLKLRARQRAAGHKGWLVSLVKGETEEEDDDDEEVREEWNREHLTTIFCLLLVFPQALEDARRR
jgi:hypothetical protein